MHLLKPSYEILTPIDRAAILQRLELAGRTCYKSEDKITPDSASKFVGIICERNHESVLEHVSITVRFICDRGVSHELVRHRIASFSQESTRYVNYGKKGIAFIIPPWVDFSPADLSADEVIEAADVDSMFFPKNVWLYSLACAENAYNTLVLAGWKPEQARGVLPNSLKTEVVMTANLREWRHIFKLRCAPAAHPQMRELMLPLQMNLAAALPEVFS